MTHSVALFGGSFNPPHIGHTMAVAYAMNQYDIDELLIMPVAKHPWSKDLIPFHHRHKMVQLSMNKVGHAYAPKIIFSTLEKDLGLSRTIDTIQEIRESCPVGTKIHLVAGNDITSKRECWHKFDEIEKLADIITFPRIGTGNVDNVSSTLIRDLIRKDPEMLNPIFRETLQVDVIAYIKTNRLY